MRKSSKIWLITAAFLVLAGAIIFSGGMNMLNWDFLKLETLKQTVNSHEIVEEYKNISIITNTSDIEFRPSQDLKSKVVCYEQEKLKHSVCVNNETLEIKIVDTRKWYEHIGINFTSSRIKVYIPKGEYGALSIKESTGDVKISEGFTFSDVKITISTGDICVSNIAVDNMELKTSTGKIITENANCKNDMKIGVSTGKSNITNVKCNNFISSGSTGDIILKNVIAKGEISIERSTGDINFDLSDAKEISIQTDTGDVKGSLLSAKVFTVNTDTGKIDVPKTTTGGQCEITTDTGDIKITIKTE